MKFEHEMIVCIVNAGFSEDVMTAARECGARGGTVLHARGTANHEAETFFKITIQPEKEVVMIIVPSAIKEEVLRAIYRNVGLKTPGQGIAFAMPVDGVAGLFKEESAPAQKGEQETNSPAKQEKTQE